MRVPATSSALSRETLSMGERLINSVRDLESSHVLLLFSNHLGNEARVGVQTKALDFLYMSPTFKTLKCSWKLYFDCPVLSAKDLVLHMTTVLKSRPVRANNAQHLSKVLNILRTYSSI